MCPRPDGLSGVPLSVSLGLPSCIVPSPALPRREKVVVLPRPSASLFPAVVRPAPASLCSDGSPPNQKPFGAEQRLRGGITSPSPTYAVGRTSAGGFLLLTLIFWAVRPLNGAVGLSIGAGGQ